MYSVLSLRPDIHGFKLRILREVACLNRVASITNIPADADTKNGLYRPSGWMRDRHSQFCKEGNGVREELQQEGQGSGPQMGWVSQHVTSLNHGPQVSFMCTL